MAKHVISEQYTFTPSGKTVIITGKAIQRERLILILNVTTNTIIYNFSDSSLGATSYSVATTGATETTTIVLTYNTTSMSTTDKLSIIVDEVYEAFQPGETVMDPVGKMRVSNPQALIDTDFEYGVQSTKWESIALTYNRPSAFYDPTQGISNISSSPYFLNSTGAYQLTNVVGTGSTRVVTVSINNTAGITTSTPIYIQDTIDPLANGWFLPSSVSAGVSFTYIARGVITTTGTIFDSTKTYLFIGAFYTGAAIPASTSAITNSGAICTATTTVPHGLSAGQAIFIVGTTASTNPPNGAWTVATTPTASTFTFDVSAQGTPTGSIVTLSPSNGLNGSIYPRTWGSSIHRAYDGGVTFSAGYPYHGNQLIRQTRRVFRYQSGKGIQFSTGSNMTSPFQTEKITYTTTVATVTVKFPHNIGVGCQVKISGATPSLLNGTFTVTGYSTPADLTFTYAISSPSSGTATVGAGGITVQPFKWYGASIRIGMFTQQNGFFFEYDGQNLYAVRRTSTNQLAGYISALTTTTSSVTGVNSLWSQQLRPGQYIVIRGMSYIVHSIESDTAMNIYPDYRGPTIASPSQVVISSVQETRYIQSSWNIDTMLVSNVGTAGAGSSQNVVDITKMQMWYMDYTWYGAGAIRWGFKDQRGEVKYVHREPHGNTLTEAYMRSGNLPGRYEVNTYYPLTVLTTGVLSGDTSITVEDASLFPSSGTLVLRASGANGVIEYVNYGSKTGNTFTSVSRGIANLTGPGGLAGLGGTASGQAFPLTGVTTANPQGTAPVQVAYWGPQAAITISHWGSSVIMDGRYDNDKSLVFVAGMQSAISNIAAGATQPLLTLRIAPSVDSGLTGFLGQREIINTMQLILNACDAFTTGTAMTFLITLRLNGVLTQGTGASQPTYVAAGGSSLSQIATHVAGNVITGGETIFGFFTNTPGVTSGDLTIVRELGNSILGGGSSNALPTAATGKYPDGPDIVTICATNVTSVTTNSIFARISWTEAQA
jgi:hypothetical protein